MNGQPDLSRPDFTASALLVSATSGRVAKPPPAANVGVNSTTGPDNAYPIRTHWNWREGNISVVTGCKHLRVDGGGGMFYFSSLAPAKHFYAR